MVTLAPSRLALTTTPSIPLSAAELTCPVSAAGACASLHASFVWHEPKPAEKALQAGSRRSRPRHRLDAHAESQRQREADGNQRDVHERERRHQFERAAAEQRYDQRPQHLG